MHWLELHMALISSMQDIGIVSNIEPRLQVFKADILSPNKWDENVFADVQVVTCSTSMQIPLHCFFF